MIAMLPNYINNGVSELLASAAWDVCVGSEGNTGCIDIITGCELGERTHPTDCTVAPPLVPGEGDCVRPLQADSKLSMHFGGLAKGCINTL